MRYHFFFPVAWVKKKNSFFQKNLPGSELLTTGPVREAEFKFYLLLLLSKNAQKTLSQFVGAVYLFYSASYFVCGCHFYLI
jgi:hypothetical protein